MFTLLGIIGTGIYLWSRASEVITHIAFARFRPSRFTDTHFEIAVDALKIWSENPFGLGLNGFGIYSPDFSTHNSYLTALTELGVVGFLVMVGTVVYLMCASRPTKTAGGFVAFLAVSAASLSALGHDVWFRFEIEFVIYLLVAFAVMDHRETMLSLPHRGTPEMRQLSRVHPEFQPGN